MRGSCSDLKKGQKKKKKLTGYMKDSVSADRAAGFMVSEKGQKLWRNI